MITDVFVVQKMDLKSLSNIFGVNLVPSLPSTLNVPNSDSERKKDLRQNAAFFLQAVPGHQTEVREW